jgi:hypothetical protein
MSYAWRTYVARWSGVVYVGFAIDVFSRRIVGWKADTNMGTGLVLDAVRRGRVTRNRPRRRATPDRAESDAAFGFLRRGRWYQVSPRRRLSAATARSASAAGRNEPSTRAKAPVTSPTTAKFTVTQPYGQVGNCDALWTQGYDLTVSPNSTFTGTWRRA